MSNTPAEENTVQGLYQPPNHPANTEKTDTAVYKVFGIMMIIACILIGFAAKIAIDLTQYEAANFTVSTSSQLTGNNITAVFSSASNKLILLILLLVVSFASIFYLVFKTLIQPLKRLEAGIAELVRGNLSAAACREEAQAFSKIREQLYEISINVQEVLLYTGTNVGNAKADILKAEEALDRLLSETAVRNVAEHLNSSKRNLDAITSILKEFEYYHTQFDGTKVTADIPGRKASNIK